MRNSGAWLALVGSAALAAQTSPHLKIDLPPDSPVGLVSVDSGDTRGTARGGALVLDLHTALSLRNSSQRRIRGITLMVLAQEVTPGGKASVTVPSLDIAPGETFPVRMDLRLLRPLQGGAGSGATVGNIEVGLDGVLFEDLSFYGPDRLNSRRAMTVYELEARRDRQYFKSVIAEGGSERLQSEMLVSMKRLADRPGMDVQMVRGGRSTNFEPEKQVQFAFLRFPDSPVDLVGGGARVAGNEARAPRLEVRNRSARPVRYLELGWILQDHQGREFVAASLPADLSLGPGQSSEILKDTTLKLPQRPGQSVQIAGMTGFISTVEFADGKVWIPSRAELNGSRLQRVLAPSPEEERLLQIYRKRGLKALIEELKKF